MFTGLIEKTAKITTAEKQDGGLLKLVIDCGEDFDATIGDSIAVNGCCLTLVKKEKGQYSFDVSSETLDKTTFLSLKKNQTVNLERAMRLGDRLGGHIVSGHVDGICEVMDVAKNAAGWFIRINIPRDFSAYVIPKGSICLDGISLTVNDLKDSASGTEISLMLIPLTLEKTTFKQLHPGQKLNFEVDLVGKYVTRANHLT